MKMTPIRLLATLAPFFLGIAHAAIRATGVRSQTPYDCGAAGGVLASFETDMSVLHLRLPDLQLKVQTPSHGFPPSLSIMLCKTTVEFIEPDFGSGYSQARFAIASATWSNPNLTLEAGDNLAQLRAKIDLDVEVSNETSPVHYPIGKDRYSSNLVNLNVNPAVGVDKPYSGEFKFTAKNPKPVFTPCFLGRYDHALMFNFDISGQTVDGGVSSAGWNVDFELIYEECHWTADQDSWGQTRIKNWESCTYRETNQTSAKRGLHGLY